MADDVDAEIPQLGNTRRLLSHVAPEPGAVLRNDRLELAGTRFGEKLLVSGPVSRATGDRRVAESCDDRKSIALSETFALAELIGDGGFRLLVGRVAGVEGGFHLCFLADLLCCCRF